MRRGTLCSVCGLALLIWGCPKRQSAPHVVYAPPPTPATPAPSEESSGTLVVEEPGPPKVVQPSPPPEAPVPKPPRRRAPRPEPSATAETAPEPVEPVPAEVPALEPRESPAEQAALRHQILRLQENVHQHVAQLERLNLVGSDRRTLEDARTFLAQSERALADGDLQRAFNLARKASLLVSALEQQP